MEVGIVKGAISMTLNDSIQVFKFCQLLNSLLDNHVIKRNLS